MDTALWCGTIAILFRFVPTDQESHCYQLPDGSFSRCSFSSTHPSPRQAAALWQCQRSRPPSLHSPSSWHLSVHPKDRSWLPAPSHLDQRRLASRHAARGVGTGLTRFISCASTGRLVHGSLAYRHHQAGLCETGQCFCRCLQRLESSCRALHYTWSRCQEAGSCWPRSSRRCLMLRCARESAICTPST